MKERWIIPMYASVIALVIYGFFLISLASAWPYQLNLTDGTLIDLNSSNINETNFTIYVIHTATTINSTIYNNYTYINITENITLQNITCINCTNYYNLTNNQSWDNQSLTKYTLLSDFNSYKAGIPTYAPQSEITAVNTRIDEIEIPEQASHIGLWITIIVSVLIGVTALIYVLRG